MRFTAKILILAILSFSIGIACASPLLISELNIRPWITIVPGQKAELLVDVVYANFTLQNEHVPISDNSGASIFYNVVVNITNPSDLGTYLTRLDFLAARQIKRTDPQNMSFGYNVEGVWLDGTWYNVTHVTVGYPSYDEDGKMYWVPMPKGQEYWMEGVQIYDTYVNSKLASRYLNMNGTWIDITGRVTLEQPTHTNYSIQDLVVNEAHHFANIAVLDFPANGTLSGPYSGPMHTVDHLVGEGLFSNFWQPHQSRLFLLSGFWDDRKPFSDFSGINALQSGYLTFKTEVNNYLDLKLSIENNTMIDTSSVSTEIKEVQLARTGDSFIYSQLDNPKFLTDKWGMEAFLESGGLLQ